MLDCVVFCDLGILAHEGENMSSENNSEDSSSKTKSIIQNTVRGGLLAIPMAGSAIEKIIFGPIDDQARRKERDQLRETLKKLHEDHIFLNADTNRQLEILAQRIEDSNLEIASQIKRIQPVQIELQLTQNIIQPIMINIFPKMTREDFSALFEIVGASKPDLLADEESPLLIERLLDSATKTGKLSELINELKEQFPNSIGEAEKEGSTKPNEVIIEEFKAASRSLMTWPTTVGDGKWIKRREVNLIIETVLSNETSTNLLLGKPGSGKSAILANLTKYFIQQGYPVLGIKADMLPKSILSLHSLQEYLNLSLPVVESINQVSKQGVILVIDQLDALSELVDRNSERLNVLLNLIKLVSNSPGIHIVSSCRWFEYQNDVRLTTIEAEKIDLLPPPWENVKIILEDTGFKVENLSDELKALLRVPLHLKILIDIKLRDIDATIPPTLQALLETIWQQRVISGNLSKEKIALIEQVCKKMTIDEELWVARALADNFPVAFQELQQGNILNLDALNLRIGFVHQTYFDFARARSFVTGNGSLFSFVTERQDGLFVRPILLRTLEYLRDAAPQSYARELLKLWKFDSLRTHIRNLLIEYMGGVENPNEAEISCMLPLFDKENLKYKILMAIAGSPGWFHSVKESRIPDMMRDCLDSPHFFNPFLSRALNFAKDDVFKLIKTFWLNDRVFFEQILNIMTNLNDWNQEAVDIICTIARQHESRWIEYLAEMVSQNKPELAPVIVRADLHRRLDQAIKEESSYKPPPLKPGADETEKAIYDLTYNKRDIIDRVLEQRNTSYDLSVIAESSPKAFLDNIWPWFIDVVKRLAQEPHPFVTGFREDHSLGTNPDRGTLSECQPITALKAAIISFSSKDPDGFLTFFYDNNDSPFLAVHRLLCIGLMQLVTIKPDIVFEYLISDPRRLAVGDSFDLHKYSKKLISAVLPYLKHDKITLLEESVMNWNKYYKTDPNWSPEDRFKRTKWNRQHRLRLLRAFPEESSSEKLNAMREQEERAFPMLPDWDTRLGGGGFVGSPMSQAQMINAKDEHILKLFEDLTDDTEWDHPKRKWDFVGGSVQASREFAAFAEKNSNRAVEIILKFIPGKQERPAGMGIAGLCRSNLPSETLFELIFDLNGKGFSSSEFRIEAARGLCEKVKKGEDLPDNILNLLKAWYEDETHPSLKDSDVVDEEKKPPEDSILWGYGGSYSLPGGRDVFVETISLGYLLRKPPEHKKFAQFIEVMLGDEKHPKVWQVTFHWMKFLFNWDKNKTSQYYDTVIKTIPEVASSKIGIRAYAEIMYMVPEKTTLQDWISQIGITDNDFMNQAYGELLVLYCFNNPDDGWGKGKLREVLNDKNFLRFHRGVAFAASNNWHNIKHQSICTEIILELSSTNDHITQKAISQLFLYREEIPLNKYMKDILSKISNNDGILIESAERLIEGVIDNTAIEPELIGNICSRIIEVGKEEIKNPGSRYSLVAEPIVSIALTLHRMAPPHREVGLAIFEELIESNIPQARNALDILDRKPMITQAPMRFRRRRRKRRK